MKSVTQVTAKDTLFYRNPFLPSCFAVDGVRNTEDFRRRLSVESSIRVRGLG